MEWMLLLIPTLHDYKYKTCKKLESSRTVINLFIVISLLMFFWGDHEIAVSGDLEVLNVQNFLARRQPW